ncbi:MAG: hypothetical protein ABSF70_15205 [Terracidiphilus sp.]
MSLDPIESDAFGFILLVERHYAGLIRTVNLMPGSEPSLGGKLLYAGQLNAEARALLIAANIAGAASMTISADASAGKQAIRDGVVDFLVTTLDEALRILKNEIRKRETVAVCVALPPGTSEADFAQEMVERGVLPDFERPAASATSEEGQVLLAWRVDSAPAIWLPKLDAVAADCLEPENQAARRWLRLAPRYLGKLAQGERLMRCSETSAAIFMERMREQVESAQIEVTVEVRLSRVGHSERHRITPLVC